MNITTLRCELQKAEKMGEIAWKLNDLKVDQLTHYQLKQRIKTLQRQYQRATSPW